VTGRRLARVLALAAAAAVLLTIALVLPLRWLPPASSSFMLQNRLAQDRSPAVVEYRWVPRSAISRSAARAVIAAEDQKFFTHAGFDMASIQAAWRDGERGRRLRGASTISQQVAKNLWLWPGRSWLRKGLEAWLTLWVEMLWPKERILEVHLNIAQFGPDVFGVEAAARRYFRKPARALTLAESARLAAVLPNPRLLRASPASSYVLRRQRWIEGQARNLGEMPELREFGRP
jgi:monofunctional biosynthetic peptidoglycan transglycosylase